MSMKKLRASNILYKYDIKAEEKFTNRIIRQCLAEPDSRKIRGRSMKKVILRIYGVEAVKIEKWWLLYSGRCVIMYA